MNMMNMCKYLFFNYFTKKKYNENCLANIYTMLCVHAVQTYEDHSINLIIYMYLLIYKYINQTLTEIRVLTTFNLATNKCPFLDHVDR